MVRPATPTDTTAIAKLMLLAMQDLVAKFRNDNNPEKSIELLEHFIGKTGNQYSYPNVLVFEEDRKVTGSITAYDGARAEALRQPFFDFIVDQYHPSGFEMELETAAGEYYIDVIGVSVDHQGKGIGRQLIESVMARATELGHKNIGLLVSLENLGARKLYEKLGFKKVGERNLLGSRHDHLILKLPF